MSSPPAKFAEPVTSFDVHVYFFQGNEKSVQSAVRLRDEIIQQFPDLEVYRLHTTPIGSLAHIE
jgi:aromatic ring-cleaving dioxygenase